MLLEMSPLDQISNVAELLTLRSDSYPRTATTGMPNLQAERKSAGKVDEAAKNKHLSEHISQGSYIGRPCS